MSLVVGVGGGWHRWISDLFSERKLSGVLGDILPLGAHFSLAGRQEAFSI